VLESGSQVDAQIYTQNKQKIILWGPTERHLDSGGIGVQC
jgi:hypothetical protein